MRATRVRSAGRRAGEAPGGRAARPRARTASPSGSLARAGAAKPLRPREAPPPGAPGMPMPRPRSMTARGMPTPGAPGSPARRTRPRGMQEERAPGTRAPGARAPGSRRPDAVSPGTPAPGTPARGPSRGPSRDGALPAAVVACSRLLALRLELGDQPFELGQLLVAHLGGLDEIAHEGGERSVERLLDEAVHRAAQQLPRGPRRRVLEDAADPPPLEMALRAQPIHHRQHRRPRQLPLRAESLHRLRHGDRPLLRDIPQQGKLLIADRPGRHHDLLQSLPSIGLTTAVVNRIVHLTTHVVKGNYGAEYPGPQRLEGSTRRRPRGFLRAPAPVSRFLETGSRHRMIPIEEITGRREEARAAGVGSPRPLPSPLSPYGEGS